MGEPYPETVPHRCCVCYIWRKRARPQVTICISFNNMNRIRRKISLRSSLPMIGESSLTISSLKHGAPFPLDAPLPHAKMIKKGRTFKNAALVVSIRMVPVKDPSHRALYCRAKDESSALLSLLSSPETRLRRASFWPVRPTWRNLPSDARRGRPEPYGSEPRQPETIQTSAWNRTGRFHGRQR